MINTLKNRMAARKEESGFTLIELLVVIVILGILSAVVVLSVGGITDKGQASAKKADENTLRVAEEAFFAQQQANPVYASETALKNGGFLNSLSTTNDICLNGGATKFEVVATGTACSTGFTLAG